MPKIWEKLTLVLLGAVVSLVLFEAIFFVFPGMIPNAFKFSTVRAYDDYMGFKFKPNINFDFYLNYDNVTFSVETKSVEFDDVGFRDDGLDDQVPFAVAVGDSFTAGWGVNLSDSWPEVLEELSGADVVNMGMPAYSIMQSARMAEKYGIELKPKVVILGVFNNDYVDSYDFENTKDGWIYFMKKVLEGNSMSYKLLRALVYSFENHESPNFIQTEQYPDTRFSMDYQRFITDSTNAAVVEGGKISQESILVLNEKLESKGIKLVLILIPLKEQVYWDVLTEARPEYSNVNLDYVTDSLIDFAEKNGIAYIDLRGSFVVSRHENIYFMYDGHLAPFGNQLVANETYKYLTKNNLLSP